MKITRFSIVVAYLLTPTFACADNTFDPFTAENTMCFPYEEIYFSCPIEKKIVSVCASGNISPENGYVQYRFGRPGKLELQFPAEPEPPKDHFFVTDFLGGSVNSTHLKFSSRGYIYVVYQSATNGVYVKKNGKTIINLSCDDGYYQQISPRAMRGIKTVTPNDDDD